MSGSAPASNPSAPSLPEVILHIGHVIDSLGYSQGLKPSQWTALRYFAAAEAAQRTVSAFADHHATTRGAASQTVEVLVGKGLLTRHPVPEDRRVVRLHLTDAAGALLAHDPLNAVAGVIDALPADDRATLAALLGRVLERVTGLRQAA